MPLKPVPPLPPPAAALHVGDFVRHKYLATDGGLKPFEGTLSIIQSDGFTITLHDGTTQWFYGTPEHNLNVLKPNTTPHYTYADGSPYPEPKRKPSTSYGVIGGDAIDAPLWVKWVALWIVVDVVALGAVLVRAFVGR